MSINYLKQFTRLRPATGRTHWNAATRHRAPNKPLLLLAVIDLFEQGLITANLIEPSDDLIDLFGLYWAVGHAAGSTGQPGGAGKVTGAVVTPTRAMDLVASPIAG